ncbi:MAG: cadherin domain-containing protein [Candidatus Thiodiazotropha sp.]
MARWVHLPLDVVGLISGQLEASDVDLAEGSDLVFSTEADVEGLTLNADGSYSFDATSYEELGTGETQTLEIPVTVTDEQGATAETTLTINVQGLANDTGSIVQEGDNREGNDQENQEEHRGKSDQHARDDREHHEEHRGKSDRDDRGERQGRDDREDQVEHRSQSDREGSHDRSNHSVIEDSNDSNSAPTAINIRGGVVEEGASSGTVVATLSTTDEDSGESFSYDLIRDDSGNFEIVGDQLVVRHGADIDYDENAVHQISIKVTDAGGDSYAETIAIHVDDVKITGILKIQIY